MDSPLQVVTLTRISWWRCSGHDANEKPNCWGTMSCVDLCSVPSFLCWNKVETSLIIHTLATNYGPSLCTSSQCNTPSYGDAGHPSPRAFDFGSSACHKFHIRVSDWISAGWNCFHSWPWVFIVFIPCFNGGFPGVEVTSWELRPSGTAPGGVGRITVLRCQGIYRHPVPK